MMHLEVRLSPGKKVKGGKQIVQMTVSFFQHLLLMAFNK